MTDIINCLTVVLEEDMKSDEAEKLILAISMMKNVLKVTPHVSDVTDHIAHVQVKNELIHKLYRVVTL